MKEAKVVFTHVFDEDLIDEITDLRLMRIGQYEKMLSDIPITQQNLAKRGVDASPEVLRKEIDEKIVELKNRLQEVDTIFADELHLYIDLAASN